MHDTVISTQSMDRIGRGRFQDLLAGTGGDCDHVLFEMQGCVVAPTLGSIIPNWLLIVPRQHAVSFREWQAKSNADPIRVVRKVLAELNIEVDRAIWFEHGSECAGSMIGCGVDHAHLHVLIDAPFSFEAFIAASMPRIPVAWHFCPAVGAYDHLAANGSYFIAGSGGDAVAADHVDSAGSQFFRRVVAELVGRPDHWDYKAHAHIENVRRTVLAYTRSALAAL